MNAWLEWLLEAVADHRHAAEEDLQSSCMSLIIRMNRASGPMGSP
ncbi:MAG TPA: hypothetical protein VI542_26035 [Candidatus Tectomicrobia bacterium]